MKLKNAHYYNTLKNKFIEKDEEYTSFFDAVELWSETMEQIYETENIDFKNFAQETFLFAAEETNNKPTKKFFEKSTELLEYVWEYGDMLEGWRKTYYNYIEPELQEL